MQHRIRGTNKQPHSIVVFLFNCLLLALEALGITNRLMTGFGTCPKGQQMPDDPCSALCRLTKVVAGFCVWTCMRIKLHNPVVSEASFALESGRILHL
jgi:hypothetical protein